MTAKEIQFEGTIEHDKAVAYLESLVSSFKKGTVCVQKGEEFVTLKPNGVVHLEVEAEEKGDKEKLSLKLSWKKEIAACECDLKISTSEPESKPKSEEKDQKKCEKDEKKEPKDSGKKDEKSDKNDDSSSKSPDKK